MDLNFKELLLFIDVPQKDLSLDKIKEFINDDETKRIDFSSSHKNVLTEYNNKWKIKLPFRDSIEPILKRDIGNDGTLFEDHFKGVWRSIDTTEGYKKWKQFIENYKSIIFLRDNLELSLSLSMNYKNESEERTEVGELVYKAKNKNDPNAERELINLCEEWLKKLPYYKEADLICAMPSSNISQENLPQKIVKSLKDFPFIDISDKVYWKSKRQYIKNVEDVDEKIQVLENSGLTIDETTTETIKEKNIIILDDLYMSGTSMQYLAMRLKEAGARRIFGLSIVKSRSNKGKIKNE